MHRRGFRTLIISTVVALSMATLVPHLAGAATSSGAKKPLIKVAIIGDYDNPEVGQAYPEQPGSIEARVKRINKSGGINGAKVELVKCNGALDANKTASCARNVVADPEIVAVIGGGPANGGAQWPLLEQAGIAGIGPSPNSPIAGASPVAFPLHGGAVALLFGMPQQLADAGAKRLSFVYPGDVPGTSAVASLVVDEGMKKTDATLVKKVTFNQGTTDFGPSIAAAGSDGVDGVIVIGTGDAEALLLREIESQGLKDKAKIITAPLFLTQDVIDSLGNKPTEGVQMVGLAQPVNATKVPGIKMFRSDMAKYGKGLDLTDLGLYNWLAMWVFERVAKDLDTVDRASVLAAMGQIRNLDMGGITPPFTTANGPAHRFGPFTRLFNTHVVYEVIKKGKVTAVTGEFVDPLRGLP